MACDERASSAARLRHYSLVSHSRRSVYTRQILHVLLRSYYRLRAVLSPRFEWFI